MNGEISHVGFTAFKQLEVFHPKINGARIDLPIYECISCGGLVIDRNKHDIRFHR